MMYSLPTLSQVPKAALWLIIFAIVILVATRVVTTTARKAEASIR